VFRLDPDLDLGPGDRSPRVVDHHDPEVGAAGLEDEVVARLGRVDAAAAGGVGGVADLEQDDAVGEVGGSGQAVAAVAGGGRGGDDPRRSSPAIAIAVTVAAATGPPAAERISPTQARSAGGGDDAVEVERGLRACHSHTTAIAARAARKTKRRRWSMATHRAPPVPARVTALARPDRVAPGPMGNRLPEPWQAASQVDGATRAPAGRRQGATRRSQLSTVATEGADRGQIASAVA
jgi:hypothetical protein